MPESVDLTLEDNALAAVVFGAFDKNLARLEQKLGVDISAFGNQLKICGPQENCRCAESALRLLYRQAHEHSNLDAHDVDAALSQLEADAAAGQEGANAAIPAQFAQVVTRRKSIRARNLRQHEYFAAMESNDLVFGTGPAGTGKTYLAVAMAASLLERQQVARIILSRPAVEAGERLGFLPGDMREKLDPYLRPLYDALYDMLPRDKIDRGLQSGAIEIAPLAFMRGRTLSNAVILLDEGQNTTSIQMKMFLTRLGDDSRMIVTGDPSQIDLPRGERSGLVEVLELIKGINGISHVQFSSSESVRHPLVERIVRAYEASKTRDPAKMRAASAREKKNATISSD